jgi:hypothetical protein
MSAVRLRIPRPQGNQPAHPPDDPLAELLAASGAEDRYFCPHGRRPAEPCYHGAHGHCAWGVRTRDDLYCAWIFIERHPHGAFELELAESLGMSRERTRHWILRALDKLRDVIATGACGRCTAERRALQELKEVYDAA